MESRRVIFRKVGMLPAGTVFDGNGDGRVSEFLRELLRGQMNKVVDLNQRIVLD